MDAREDINLFAEIAVIEPTISEIAGIYKSCELLKFDENAAENHFNELRGSLRAIATVDQNGRQLINQFAEYLETTREQSEMERDLVDLINDKVMAKLMDNADDDYSVPIFQKLLADLNLLDAEFFDDVDFDLNVFQEPMENDEPDNTRTKKRKNARADEDIDGTKKGGKKLNFNSEVTQKLMRWFAEHLTSPYPSGADLKRLAKDCGITPYQVRSWFVNARRRRRSEAEKLALGLHIKPRESGNSGEKTEEFVQLIASINENETSKNENKSAMRKRPFARKSPKLEYQTQQIPNIPPQSHLKIEPIVINFDEEDYQNNDEPPSKRQRAD